MPRTCLLLVLGNTALWGFILAAGIPRAVAERLPGPVTDLELESHLERLRPRIPPGFSVVAARPFLVIGDESHERVRMRAQRVRWAAGLLERDFFPRSPPDVIEVWVFGDEAGYRRGAPRLSGDRPPSPYGFFSASRRAIVTHVAEGDETLVHELVHPYVRANLPGCPAWLNEGLAALFERPVETGGHLRGRMNWRLRALQTALAAGTLTSIAALTSAGDEVFYDDPDGTHYEAARHLCFYLQERERLVEFVRRFREGQAADPTGLKTLLAVLGEPDVLALEASWRRFVAGLEPR